MLLVWGVKVEEEAKGVPRRERLWVKRVWGWRKEREEGGLVVEMRTRGKGRIQCPSCWVADTNGARSVRPVGDSTPRRQGAARDRGSDA